MYARKGLKRFYPWQVTLYFFKILLSAYFEVEGGLYFLNFRDGLY
jgi:hypothetical protein